MDLLVLAKEPVPGRVKTRLTPPCTPHEAAALAEAALADTLDAAVRTGVDRVVLGLDGSLGEWCPPGVVVVEQGDGGLSDRLERLWSHARGPALQIGMDTPQVTPAMLHDALVVLGAAGLDAVLGAALDGGWWAIGFAHRVVGAFHGVDPSRFDTGARQLDRLVALGLRVGRLPSLRDVDHWDDAMAVAADAPTTRFATAVRRRQTLAGVR